MDSPSAPLNYSSITVSSACSWLGSATENLGAMLISDVKLTGPFS